VSGVVTWQPFVLEPVVEFASPVGLFIVGGICGGIVARRRGDRDKQYLGVFSKDVFQRSVGIAVVGICMTRTVWMAIDGLIVGKGLFTAEGIAWLGAIVADIADRIAALEHDDFVDAIGTAVALHTVVVVVKPKEPVVHIRVVARCLVQRGWPASISRHPCTVGDVITLTNVRFGE